MGDASDDGEDDFDQATIHKNKDKKLSIRT